MKSLLIFLMSLSFLTSCSTGNKSKSSTNINDLEDEFSWLDNKDFKKVFEVKYSSKSDTYPEELADEDSLSKESIARLPEAKLDNVIESDNVISKIVGKCYQKNFENAQDLIRKSRREYKQNPSFWNQVGTCYFLQGEKRKALIFYNKAISLKKNYAPAVNNLGVLHQSEGNDQRALAAYEEAARLGSFSLTPSFNKAQLFLKYGFIKKSEQIFTALWKNNKRDTDVVHALGVIYLQQKRYSKSVSAFQSLKYKFQELPEVALNYALALSLSGDNEKAKTILEGIDNRKNNKYISYYTKVKNIVGATK